MTGIYTVPSPCLRTNASLRGPLAIRASERKLSWRSSRNEKGALSSTNLIPPQSRASFFRPPRGSKKPSNPESRAPFIGKSGPHSAVLAASGDVYRLLGPPTYPGKMAIFPSPAVPKRNPSDPKKRPKMALFSDLRRKVRGEWGGSAHSPDPTAQSAPEADAARATPGPVRGGRRGGPGRPGGGGGAWWGVGGAGIGGLPWQCSAALVVFGRFDSRAARAQKRGCPAGA